MVLLPLLAPFSLFLLAGCAALPAPVVLPDNDPKARSFQGMTAVA